MKLIFKLQNGINTEGKHVGEISLFPNGIFLSFEEAIKVFVLNRHENFWDHSYFPIFSNGEGDFILVQIAPIEDYGQYYFYSPSNVDFNSIISIYDNESSLVETVISCYKRNIYYMENNLLQVDFDSEAILSKLLNPLSLYWDICTDDY